MKLLMCDMSALSSLHRRHQFQKSPEPATVMKPLMCDMASAPASQPPQTDPVDLRRQDFQTPGMMSHPPVHIAQLAEHVDALKANDNTKFLQEYEVGVDRSQKWRKDLLKRVCWGWWWTVLVSIRRLVSNS